MASSSVSLGRGSALQYENPGTVSRDYHTARPMCQARASITVHAKA